MLKRQLNIAPQWEATSPNETFALRAEDFWPCSLNDLTQADLLSLDDDEFIRLQRFFRERAYKQTRSKAHARSIVRLLKNRRTPYSHPLFPARYVDWKYKPSILLESFIDNRPKKWLPKKKRFVGRE